MKLSSVVSVLAFLSIAGSGIYLAGVGRRTSLPTAITEAEPAAREAPIQLARRALAANDLDAAARHLIEARLQPASADEAWDLLAEIARRRHQACGVDVGRFLDLFTWSRSAGVEDSAWDAAVAIHALDPTNSTANAYLRLIEYQGEWFEPAQLAERINAALNTDAQRALETSRLRERMARMRLQVFEDSRRDRLKFYDDAPLSPFIVFVEPDPSFDAEIHLQQVAEVLGLLRVEFNTRFGRIIRTPPSGLRSVLPVCVFPNRQRYLETTGAPGWTLSHYDRQAGAGFAPADGDDPNALLFHEGTHLLVDAAYGLRGGGRALHAGLDAIWVSRGLPCLFESWRRDETGWIVFGGAVPTYTRDARALLDRGGMRALREFLSVRSRDYVLVPETEKRARAMETQSWALAYFLWEAGNGRYREKLLTYLDLEWQGKGGLRAAVESFGDLDILDAEFQEFVRQLPR